MGSYHSIETARRAPGPLPHRVTHLGDGLFYNSDIGGIALTIVSRMVEAPALDVAELLQREGAQVRAYDPVGMERASQLVPEIEMARDAYALADQADAIIVCTEWNEFLQLDLERIHDLMRQPVIIDGRNIYDPKQMARLGFKYLGFGQGYGPDGSAVSQVERTKEEQPSL